MIQYRLSVGRMTSSPNIELKNGNPPAYRISYKSLSDVFDNFNEMEFTAYSLIACSSTLFGYELEPSSNFGKVLDAVKQYPYSCIRGLANGRRGSFMCGDLYIETYNPNITENYGIYHDGGENRLYGTVWGVHKSKLFAAYKDTIDLDTLKHRFLTEERFTFEDSVSGLPRVTCCSYIGTIYEEMASA